jgi:hypothetical protein
MNGKLFVVMTLVIASGIQPVFAQTVLPEPSFHESAGAQSSGVVFPAAGSPAAGFQTPDFDDLVHYLWDFAPVTLPEPVMLLPAFTVAAAASTDAGPEEIPHSIRNNQYYLESLRLTQLAQESYEEGDYDASTAYAEEAIRFARLSDDYVALQLKIKKTNDAITEAKKALNRTVSSGAAKLYPSEYDDAEMYYNTSLTARSDEEWDAAFDAANRVFEILAYIQPSDGKILPAYYTVRTWPASGDCLWNIAGRPWAYNDPTKWRIIYDANKSRMPQSGNPDLINPGMTLEIPSIRDEERRGLWVEGIRYEPLR